TPYFVGWGGGVGGWGVFAWGPLGAGGGGGWEVTSHGRHVAGYGRLTLRNGFSVTADVLYSHYDNDSDRLFNTSRVHSEFSQRVVGGGVEARWDLNPGVGNWTLSPFASLRVNHYNQGASREGGDALWAVRASSENGTVWSGAAGAEAGYDFILPNAVVSPRLRAAYRRDGGDTSVSRRVSLAGAPGSVVIHGVRPGKDNLLLGASLEAAVRTRAGILDVRVGYDFSLRRRSTGHGISVTAGLAF
ncbi:MAG: autotransporter outer membrane beta-barrel domain-containing protein, partial [Planctomycetaceae bacterium]|nr:autotransporter outer membrane beta-barrel domain-containing protein [Planctomycetaceae bacterium]